MSRLLGLYGRFLVYLAALISVVALVCAVTIGAGPFFWVVAVSVNVLAVTGVLIDIMADA